MVKLKRHAPTQIFSGFIVLSLLVGWFLPTFVDWTGTRQNHPSPLLWQIPLLFAVVAAGCCAGLPRTLMMGDSNRDAASAQPLASTRYSLRRLLLVTAGVAVTMAVLVKHQLFGGSIVTAGAIVYFIRFWRQYPQHRLAASTLLAYMILPFVWVVGYKDLGRIFPMVLALFGAFPTLGPVLWIGQLFGVRMIANPGICFLLTALELVAGLWLIRLGPKRTIAYLLVVLLLSFMGSIFLNGAVRA